MTGGPARSASINRNIAEAAQNCRIAFGVGSQRVALEHQGDGGLTKDLRKLAPDVPVLANLGGAQLKEAGGLALAQRAVDMIEADALIVHLNPVQEAVQAGGDTDWRGVLNALEDICRTCSVPVIVKEVGFGISGASAKRLKRAGVAAIDVAGAGGTSWAAVEAERAPDPKTRAIAETFRDWGIPTATAIRAVRTSCPDITVIASGGIKTGVDVAKAIRLGADLAGQAAGALGPAIESPDSLQSHIDRIIAELRIACFATASPDLTALRNARLIGAPDTN
jgi:isopentenyl-diphosphate delta-isomerase